ncbi:MAG: amino acid adenylation domain-containing protein [Byssovorax sp.]
MSSVDIAETYPLSGMQHAMLAHTLLAPGSGVDILQLELTLREAIDLAALQGALQAMIDRHPVLRTAFRWKGLEEPQQDVRARAELSFTRADLSASGRGEAHAAIAAYLEDDRLRGFDPSIAPLHRVALFTLGPEDHRLIWTFHHALVDGRSLRVVVTELFAVYDARRRGEEPALSPCRPHRDYIDWLGRLDHERARPFWRALLAGFTAPTPLPLGRPLGKGTAAVGFGSLELDLPAAQTRALARACEAEQVTLGAAVHGAWAIVLSTFSGDRDVLFGATRACRRTALGGDRTDTIVGPMFNALPLRLEVDPDAPLFAWLRDLRALGRSIGDHEHTPQLRVKKWSDVGPGRPLFETVVAYEDKLLDGTLGPRGASRRFYNGPSFAAMLSAYGGERLVLRLTYERARYDPESAEKLLGHVAELLRAMAAASAQTKLHELSMIGEAERALLVTTWNDTAAPYPAGEAAHTLFEAQVDRTPGAPALRFEGAELTYREVERRANQLARRLLALGLGPEDRVGIHVTRSLDLLIAPLAVLKAGGCYVPLDPDYPAARLAFMLEDSGARFVIASGDLPAELEGPPAVVIHLDRERDSLAREDGGRPPPVPGGERLAYLIYTSGSTGRPKGVEIPHRALLNFLCSMARDPGMRQDDRLLAVTSLSFDIAGLELFLPLAVGAMVEIAGRTAAADGPALRARIERSGITVVQATPTTFRLLLDAGLKGGERLTVLVGGEMVPADLVARLYPKATAVYDMYGPTETTIWSTVHRFEDAAEPVSVGRPIANTRVYVLGERRELLPIGAPGQVYIGGHGLARGYHGRPDLTAERFVPDPFLPGEIIYATGDLGRLDASGRLSILGRIDQQVKVRGHRIELGEIESVLGEHPGVSQAIAVAGEDRIVAHVVPRDPSSPPSPAELRDHLRPRLPAYMIPAAIRLVASLPLLPNGKVDRRALPLDEPPLRESPGTFAGPSTALEADLVALWESVLGVRPIGTHDDFFELGGHSLLAARLFDRIESRTGRRLPLATLLSAPTVQQLATLLGQEGWSPSWSSLVAIRAEGTRPPFFCVHAIGGNVLNYRKLALHLGPDQPLYGLQARGLDGRPSPAATVEEMAASYLSEIRSVQPRGPYRLGGASSGGVVAFEMAQQLRRAGEEVALLVLMDTVLAGPPPPEASIHPRVYSLDRHLGQLLLSPEETWADYFIAKARARLDAIGEAVRAVVGQPKQPELTTFEIVTARDRAAMRAYAPTGYDGAIVLILARDEAYRTAHDLRLRWAELAAGGLTIHVVPGTHATILDDPTVKDVAAHLTVHLDRAADRRR